MKFSIEEIKGMLEGITPGEWETRMALPYSQAILVFSGRFKENSSICQMLSNSTQGNLDGKFIAAAPTIIRDLLAKIEIYERKHEEVAALEICPENDNCCGDDISWSCKKCWNAYWEEE